MQTVQDVGRRLGVAPTCAAVELARATYYRGRRPPAAPRPRRIPRALLPAEQGAVLAVLHEPRFMDLAPAEVYATLLDKGHYLCSERTRSRLLAAHHEVRERRDQRRHPPYAAPALLATRPNELWSWDLTTLLGPAKWTYFYLYVILDVFSRYAVGWMVAPCERTSLAERLIETTCPRQGIVPGHLAIHADRGSSMTSKAVALLLADLGVTTTHSRPHVSNDTPSSASQFKTLKYRPAFPACFGSLVHARTLSGRSCSGTTMNITTWDSGCSPRTTCTMDSPRRRSRSGPACSRRPMRRTPSVFCATRRPRRRGHRPCGSISRRAHGAIGPPAWFSGHPPKSTHRKAPGSTIST